jgi:hypothetical protein
MSFIEILTVILKITYEITTMNTFNRLLFYTVLWSSFLYSYLPNHNFMSNDQSCSSLYAYESAYYGSLIRDYYTFKSCLVPFVTTESKSLKDVLLSPISTKRFEAQHKTFENETIYSLGLTLDYIGYKDDFGDRAKNNDSSAVCSRKCGVCAICNAHSLSDQARVMRQYQ